MESLLEEEYNKLNNNNLGSSGICNILNNIIQIKIQEPHLQNFLQHISIDIKKYFNSLITQAEEGTIGYDNIEVKKVKELLDCIKCNERIIYIDYFIRQLQKSSFDLEIRGFQKLRTKILIEQSFRICQNERIPKIWNFFIYFPQYNAICLLSTLIFIGVLTSTILLPAPYDAMEIFNFKITYEDVSSNFYLNHFLNFFSGMVGIETNFKIIPQNSFTLVNHILAKVLCFIFIINYLFSKLGEFLKR